jgi:hypothetical protein
MKVPEYSISAVLILIAIILVVTLGNFNLIMLLVSGGSFFLTVSLTKSVMFATISGVVALLTMSMYMKRGEGFRTRGLQPDISSRIQNMKANKKEGFLDTVYKNITPGAYSSPGAGMNGPLVEGFEDESKKKNGAPAPAEKSEDEDASNDNKNLIEKAVATQKAASSQKNEMPQQFKLGEIPSQVKNGPHIDAGSTLIKTIQGLNPDQINAMTKDTQQLIETQKSLMGMLGTMKPMMQDGKELMDTFQQMFGQ